MMELHTYDLKEGNERHVMSLLTNVVTRIARTLLFLAEKGF